MRHRNIGDLMTASVVHVGRSTPFKDIAVALAENDITAVPVVDRQQRPIGMVSEHDLLSKAAGQADPGGHLLAAELPPLDPAKATAATAGELMTSPAVVARPQWSIVEAARVMERHGIKRLPVVDDTGQLIGIVSRGDLLRVFLRRDRAIREEIEQDVLMRTLGIGPSAITVEVTEGMVTISGTVERRSLAPVTERLCRAVDGVVGVTSHLDYEVDDTEEPSTPRP